MNRLERMKLAINDAELAIGEITAPVALMTGADDSVMMKVRLGTLRQIVRCYPALNELANEEI